MKKILFLLLFPIAVLAQNDSISVVKKTNTSIVSADRMNVVYRGIPNPISISASNDKQFSAFAPGLEILGNGKFILRPGSGNEIDILVRFKKDDGEIVIEKHTFRIKGLPSGFALINGYGCDRKCVVELSKEELLDAEISYEMPNFLFDPKINVTSFKISFIDSSYKNIADDIEVQGNKIDEKKYLDIKKIKNTSFFIIISDIQIQIEDFSLYICKISPIKVLVTD